MYGSNLRLHFKHDDAYGGFAEVNGVMRADETALVLEYVTKDAILGVVRSDPKTLTIPYSQIASVEYKRTWFKSRFRILINSIEILQQFPASGDGMISLQIKRKFKQTAADLASHVNLLLSEHRLDAFGGGFSSLP